MRLCPALSRLRPVPEDVYFLQELLIRDVGLHVGNEGDAQPTVLAPSWGGRTEETRSEEGFLAAQHDGRIDVALDLLS